MDENDVKYFLIFAGVVFIVGVNAVAFGEFNKEKTKQVALQALIESQKAGCALQQEATRLQIERLTGDM